MWYRLAIVTDDLDMAKVNEYMSILRASPKPRIKFRDLLTSIGDMSPDRAALQAAWQSINNESGSNPTPKPPSPPKPNPNPAPAPNTTVKDLIPLDQLEKRDSNEGPSDLIVRPPGGELDLYKPKKEDDDPEKPKKDDGDCIIEEEVFIQNLLTGLTGYAQIYFKKKIFTISQDTYRGNRSLLAPVQTALGLTPPGRLGPNTQAYDPASMTAANPLGFFARPAGAVKDQFGNWTAPMPVKDKTVVWNTADVQSIMSSLEKIAQMPELQKYGAKEITNILRYPLLQVKGSTNKIRDEIFQKKLQIERYEAWALNPDPRTSPESIKEDIKDLKEELKKLEDSETSKKPDVEVVPFKEFYKLTELSRYFMYEPHVGAGKKQINGVFCKLEAQLIKTLNNTLNTLGKMEKNKRLKDIYENARGKK